MTTLARIRRYTAEKKAIASACWAMRRDPARAGEARALRRPEARPGDRPDQRTRPRQRLPAGGLDGGPLAHRAGRRVAARRCAPPPRKAAPCTCRPCSTSRPWASHRGLRQQHPPGRLRRRREERVRLPRLRAGVCAAAVLPRQGPFRWVALSGDPDDIRKTDAKMKELFPEDRHLHRWLDMAGERIAVPGPAGAHLLDRPGRAPPRRPGVQRDGEVGELKAPSSSAATTSTAARWPAPTGDRKHARRQRRRERLAAAERAAATPPVAPPGSACTTAAASAWATASTGVVIVCDGTDEAARASNACCGTTRHRRDAPCRRRLRHRPAACAREQGLNLPMLGR